MGQQPRWGCPDVKLPVSWHRCRPHAGLKARGGASAQQALSERLLSVSTVGDKTVWGQTWGQRDERRWKERAEVDPAASGQGDSAQQSGVTPGQEAAGPVSHTHPKEALQTLLPPEPEGLPLHLYLPSLTPLFSSAHPSPERATSCRQASAPPLCPACQSPWEGQGKLLGPAPGSCPSHSLTPRPPRRGAAPSQDPGGLQHPHALRQARGPEPACGSPAQQAQE